MTLSKVNYKLATGEPQTLISGRMLQRKCACNGTPGPTGACAECRRKRFGVQTKLTVNRQGDKYEAEADRMADQVMRMPAPSLQRQVDEREELLQAKPLGADGGSLLQRQAEPEEEEEENEPLQTKPLARQQATHQAAPATAPPAVHNVLRSPGQMLDPATRAFMEPRFGHNFGQVRVHADAKAAQSARSVNAQAYTVGNDVVFSTGQFSPGTIAGRQLLAHELAHVIQQRANVGTRVQRKIDKITTDKCNFVLWMTIGIYGSRANSELAKKWQSWINTEWSNEVRCPDNNNACPVRMVATVNAHPDARRPRQVPETNRVRVAEPGFRSKAIGRWGKWAEDEDRLSVAHETGHLMGLIDRYWQVGARKSMSRFENDIMADYYRDPGPTEFHNALARVLARRRMVCPCCNDEALNGELRERSITT